MNAKSALVDEAKRLLEGLGKASLGTLAERAGAIVPFVSLVEAAPGPDGAVLLLLSDLSDHARHLKMSPKASLLIDATGESQQPLAGPRLTLLGSVQPSPDPAADREQYLARFPAAALYADFADFRFYRLLVEEAYFVAGFGRVARLRAADLA